MYGCPARLRVRTTPRSFLNIFRRDGLAGIHLSGGYNIHPHDRAENLVIEEDARPIGLFGWGRYAFL